MNLFRTRMPSLVVLLTVACAVLLSAQSGKKGTSTKQAGPTAHPITISLHACEPDQISPHAYGKVTFVASDQDYYVFFETPAHFGEHLRSLLVRQSAPHPPFVTAVGVPGAAVTTHYWIVAKAPHGCDKARSSDPVQSNSKPAKAVPASFGGYMFGAGSPNDIIIP